MIETLTPEQIAAEIVNQWFHQSQHCGDELANAIAAALQSKQDEIDKLRTGLQTERDRADRLEALLSLRDSCPPDKGEGFANWLEWAVKEVARDPLLALARKQIAKLRTRAEQAEKEVDRLLKSDVRYPNLPAYDRGNCQS